MLTHHESNPSALAQQCCPSLARRSLSEAGTSLLSLKSLTSLTSLSNSPNFRTLALLPPTPPHSGVN